MKLIAYYGNYRKKVNLNFGLNNIILDNEFFIIDVKQTKWKILDKRDVQVLINNNHHIQLWLNNTQQCIDLFIYRNNSDLLTINKYKLPSKIIISKQKNADIIVYSLTNEIIIDTIKREIVTNTSDKIYFENYLTYNKNIQNGLYAINELEFCLTTNFIEIVDSIYYHINLKKLTNNCVVQNKVKYELIKQQSRIILNEPLLKINLPSYSLEIIPDQHNILLIIGPTITMSMATLSSGLISFHYAYTQGRNLLEVLPMLILPIVMLMSALIWTPLNHRYSKRILRKKQTKKLKEFTDNLANIQNLIDNYKQKYEEYNSKLFYSIEDIFLLLINKKNIWFKQATDVDFLKLSFGYGKVKLPIIYKDQIYEDNNIQKQIDNFKKKNAYLSQGKIFIDLLALKRISIYYTIDFECFFYYLWVQLITYYDYKTVKIALAVNDKWLKEHYYLLNDPHLFYEQRRLTINSLNQTNLLYKSLKKINSPTILFYTKDYIDNLPTLDNVICIYFNSSLLDHPLNNQLFINLQNKQPIFTYANGEIKIVNLPIFAKDKFIKFHYLYNKYCFNSNIYLQGSVDFYQMCRISPNIKQQIMTNWQNNNVLKHLSFALGLNENRQLISLDIHESKQGPHGIIAGSTGSGKSQLILTMIMSLAISYSPNQLQFVILDFKGGELVNELHYENHYLPHLLNTLTDLSKDEINRCLVSFKNEFNRRHKLFAKLSEVKSMAIDIDQYNKYKDKQSPFLPHLVIIVDEFAELKLKEPDFLAELVSIARVGRSLGIHLILSTQKPAGVINQEIWANSSYKICLKVQDVLDSKEVLHNDLAASLSLPGEFVLLTDNYCEIGKIGYLQHLDPYLNQDNQVSICDNVFINKYVLKTNGKNIKQKDSILKALLFLEREMNLEKYPLWLKKINDQQLKKLSLKYLGIIDDYTNRRQYPLRIKENILIYSNNLLAKINIIKNFIKQELANQKTKIILIDFFQEDYGLKSNVVKGNNIYLIKNLLNKLIKTTKLSIYTTIIISDYDLFIQQDEQMLVLLTNLIRQSISKNLKIIILSSSCISVPFAISSLFKQKVVLSDIERNDLSSIFLVNMPIYSQQDNLGFIKIKEVLPIYFPLIKQLPNNILSNLVVFKPILLPDKITSKITNCFAYDYASGNALCFKKGLTIIVAKKKYLIKKYLAKLNLDVTYCDENLNFDDEHIFLLICSVSQFNCLEQQLDYEYNLLWLHEGYNQQYCFMQKVNQIIKHNEGVYHELNEIKVVRLIDE